MDEDNDDIDKISNSRGFLEEIPLDMNKDSKSKKDKKSKNSKNSKNSKKSKAVKKCKKYLAQKGACKYVVKRLLSRKETEDGKTIYSVRDKFVLACLDEKDYPEVGPLASVFERAIEKAKEKNNGKAK